MPCCAQRGEARLRCDWRPRRQPVGGLARRFCAPCRPAPAPSGVLRHVQARGRPLLAGDLRVRRSADLTGRAHMGQARRLAARGVACSVPLTPPAPGCMRCIAGNSGRGLHGGQLHEARQRTGSIAPIALPWHAGPARPGAALLEPGSPRTSQPAAASPPAPLPRTNRALTELLPPAQHSDARQERMPTTTVAAGRPGRRRIAPGADAAPGAQGRLPVPLAADWGYSGPAA